MTTRIDPAALTRDVRARAAVQACETLRRAGSRALLAGGCVRDLILGVEPKDYDIATDARPEQVAMLFERTVPVGAAFGVQLLVMPEGCFEVTTFRSDGPYFDGRHPANVTFRSEAEDARRRDFTINALFLDPVSGEIVDYVGGLADMERRVVRAVGEARRRFDEDHLRLLRAVRFAARLGFEMDPATFDALREMAPRIVSTSPERIRDEIVKMLTEGAARRAFEWMDASGLLEPVLPEVARMKGVEQPRAFHPEGDVYAHTLLMLEKLPAGVSPTLALGVLLHDVGKPATQTFEDRIRFNNHDKVGAEIAHGICRRLRLSNAETDRVVWLTAQHMRAGLLPDMREGKRRRFVREKGFGELLELLRIDCIGSHGDLETVAWISRYLAGLTPEKIRPPRLLTGDDLIAMGYKPGPCFARILAALEDAQLEEAVSTPEEARAFLQTHWPLPASS
ncbi:MAG TPA: CCA tRNA nucleotidyltransferase [Candidatus Hydrogenedentes bacterium]|nr:CCA tRNA nucleotidyltransferase [Candidatus Hydrogenedentota bacterium]HOS01532.1 CCA tRNA nucleotidyltransferase [Candidatus Hydrogenedentota bacterium]